MYTLILKERILPEYRNTLTFSQRTVIPARLAIHQSHVANGNVISETWVIDHDDQYSRTATIVYKSKEIAEQIFVEQNVASGFARIEGYEVYSTTGFEH